MCLQWNFASSPHMPSCALPKFALEDWGVGPGINAGDTLSRWKGRENSTAQHLVGYHSLLKINTPIVASLATHFFEKVQRYLLAGSILKPKAKHLLN